MSEATHRPTIEVPTVVGGWPAPWPNVAELASVLPADKWTLVGGLMTQLHTVRRGLGVVRPTNDVDIVLHIETSRGVPAATASALESIGYSLMDTVDPRQNTAHRFVRGDSSVDVVANADEPDGPEDGPEDGAGEAPEAGARPPAAGTVDVLRSDHPGPAIIESMRGRTMVAIDGGTQALRRTVNARIEIAPGTDTVISVPRPFAAVVLKAAAYLADSRDRERHLFDAAALLACVEDPFVEREGFAGSDRKRLLRLQQALPESHLAWRQLGEARDDAQATLDVLLAQP